MFKYLALEIVKATVTLFCRLLHNQVSTDRLLWWLRHLASESKFVSKMDVDDILVKKRRSKSDAHVRRVRLIVLTFIWWKLGAGCFMRT